MFSRTWLSLLWFCLYIRILIYQINWNRCIPAHHGSLKITTKAQEGPVRELALLNMRALWPQTNTEMQTDTTVPDFKSSAQYHWNIYSKKILKTKSLSQRGCQLCQCPSTRACLPFPRPALPDASLTASLGGEHWSVFTFRSVKLWQPRRPCLQLYVPGNTTGVWHTISHGTKSEAWAMRGWHVLSRDLGSLFPKDCFVPHSAHGP